MEQIIARENLVRALQRVQRNHGSPGVDGLTVDDLPAYLKQHWPAIREQLLTGRYQPSAVKRVEIPKPGGGMRTLGIPTVLDRFIQQAVLQVLQPQIDPTFSESSYSFRPHRRVHDAICQAQRYVQSGRRWVVDVDLEKFFDRVNHNVLMGTLASRIADAQVRSLIRRYLTAGLMADGWCWIDTRERRKVVPCRRCWRTCCWTRWTRRWSDAVTVSYVMPMTATCMCGRSRRRNA